MQPVDPRSLASQLVGTSNPRNVSRRSFLKDIAWGTAALGSMSAFTQSSYALELATRINKVRGNRALDRDLLALVNRTSFGYSAKQYALAEEFGYEDYIEWQLDHENIADDAMDERLDAYDSLTMTSQEVVDNYDNDDGRFIPALELMSASFERGTYSERQLFERMVEFWTDHFSIFIGDDLCLFLKTADDRDVIRRYAMSSVPELLHASAHSAAMLFYLDNYTNIVGAAQENYSRELMELHTLGVTGPYTQQDVEEVARCLTGWTIYDSPLFGNFVFWEPFHDFGQKTVLGQAIPAGGGESDGITVLDILAYHPATAGFIAKKLCTYFLGYNPPQPVVDSVTQIYLDTDGDIKSMLRYILQRNILVTRSTPKYKRPFHFLASMIRATDGNAVINNYPNYPYLGMLQAMGHLPFWWEPPNGYPDELGPWVGGQLPRWQSASYYFDGLLGVSMDLDALVDSEYGGQSGEFGTAIDRVLAGGMMDGSDIVEVQKFYDKYAGSDPFVLSDAFGLAASSPGFQWY